MAAAVNLRLCGCVGGCEEFMLSDWLVLRRRIFMLAVDSWRFRNMKFMRKFFFSKIFLKRRKMRKNDIKESELNGLICTYVTVLQDQTGYEKV